MIAFEDHNLVACSLGLIATIWFVAFLVYQRQNVNIELYAVGVERTKGGVNIRLKGFIWSRHLDGLYALEFFIIHSIGLRTAEGNSSIPKTTDSRMQNFIANFFVSNDVLERAVKEQDSDGVNIAFILSAKMRGRDLLYRGFNIHPFFVANEKLLGEVMEMKGGMPKEGKKRDGLGINKKQFHEILKKVSQPIKKSEKGKS